MTRATTPQRAAREVTYEEYLATPETNRPVEVVDGVIHVMATPTFKHQRAVLKITLALERRVDLDASGIVVVSPADLLIRKLPKLRVRQPDVMFFSNAQAGFRASEDPDRLQDEGIAPDLAVEVLSPGQDERTLADKLGDYASIRIEEVWFVDQEAKAVRVLAREGEGYRLAGQFGIGDRVVSAVLPGLDLEVAEVFA